MFADLDESIRQLLIQRGNLDSGEVDIAFNMPTRDWAAGISRPTVNVYLYDIRENTDRRNPAPWNVRPGPNNTAIKSRPEFRMDLTYRVTAFASVVEDEHRLLSRVLLTLLRHTILPAELLQGEVAGQEITTVAGRPDGPVASPADYWSAMASDIKPSIDYKVTASLDLEQEIAVGLALTSRIRVSQIDHRNGAASAEEIPLQFGGRIHRAENAEEGIAGAKVTLLERALDALTDEGGRYTFSGVPPGTYTLVVAAPDMEEQRVELAVPSASYDVGL